MEFYDHDLNIECARLAQQLIGGDILSLEAVNIINDLGLESLRDIADAYEERPTSTMSKAEYLRLDDAAEAYIAESREDYKSGHEEGHRDFDECLMHPGLGVWVHADYA